MKYILSIIPILLLTLILQSCGSLSLNIFPISEDKNLGKNLDQQIRSNTQEYPILTNTTVKNYLQGIVDVILKSPKIEYKKDFIYKVEVINRDDVINAFAAPGGYIYVYTGLLKFLDNEATLAAVLAHEIAHAERRHVTQRMTKAYGIQFVMDLVKEKSGGNKYAEVASNMFSGLGLLYNSRENEYEADEYAFEYLKSTRWYPGALNYFFEKISVSLSTEGTELDNLMSTHPLSRKRMDNMDEMIRKANLNPPNEKSLYYRDYQNMLKEITK